MQRLEVSGVVQPLLLPFGVKGLMNSLFNTTVQYDLHRRQCQFYDKYLHTSC